MAGLLNNAVFVLVLITAAKQFIVAIEGLGSTATEVSTADGQENIQRSAGKYPAELCNPFYKFWETHQLVWTFRTSDTAFYECQRQKRKDYNESGVMLTLLGRFSGERISTDYFWTFNADDSMYRGHKDGNNNYMLLLREVLEYDSSANKCGVVKVEEWWYHTEESKEKYFKICAKDNSTWCNCTRIAEDTKAYLCLNNPVHELVMYGKPTENLADDCKNEYDKRRVLYRKTDNKVYQKNCEKEESLDVTSSLT